MNFNYQKHKGIGIIFVVVPVIVFFASFLLGRYPVTPIEVILTLLSVFDPNLAVSDTVTGVVFNIRLPRIMAAMLVGATLAAVGTTFQGIFKNPLVSPDILGVSSGAGFGAAISILMSAGSYVIQLFAFISGLVSVFLTYGVSKVYKYGGILVLVLSGMAVSSLFGAMISTTKYLADPNNKLPEITFWLMGSFSSITMEALIPVCVTIIIGLSVLLLLRWRLNILAMGDEESESLGINTEKLRIILIIIATFITSAAVSISGVIGWVGLIVPHMTRIITGPDNTVLLPASLCFGASFLLLMDDISRIAFTVEIPIGILTALLGAPLFLLLLKKGYHDWN